ncbi:MAG: hypothetical protein ABF904_15530, partial [Ethanoligenens sp.]
MQISSNTTITSNITADTEWSKTDSPYYLSNNIQIAKGATLTIDPGVTIYGNGHSILNYGSVAAIGDTTNRISLNTLELDSGNNNSTPCTYNLQYLDMSGGKLFSPTGEAMSINLTIQHSTFINIADYTYIWYPANQIDIGYNIFENTGTLSIGSNYNVYIHNNDFYNINTS